MGCGAILKLLDAVQSILLLLPSTRSTENMCNSTNISHLQFCTLQLRPNVAIAHGRANIWSMCCPQLANIFLQLLLKVPNILCEPLYLWPPLLSNGYIVDREHFAFMFTTSLCMKRNEHQKLVCAGAITGRRLCSKKWPQFQEASCCQQTKFWVLVNDFSVTVLWHYGSLQRENLYILYLESSSTVTWSPE